MSTPPLPRIAILDSFTLNPGDLSWSGLAELGELEIHDWTPPELVHDRAAGAPIVLTNKTVLSGDTLRSLPDLRYIGVLATGYNVVDLATAAERRIAVSNVPGYAAPSVGQAVFALLLELTNRTGHHAQAVTAGRWTASRDFCFWDGPLVELNGLTLGIVGYGAIGQNVATIARALGMRVIVHSRRPVANEDNVPMDELFRRADVVSLHCPLTPSTERMINAKRLATMKPSAFLINTGRGGLVDEPALADALNRGQIAGAGLDVLSKEPPPADNPLLTAKNCIITPHIAWATKASRERLLGITVANVRAFLAGTPQNLVTPPA
ncbi:MAG TPA: D-2-hydroxyacid dehydrogenase [Chthoniobacter sp.]